MIANTHIVFSRFIFDHCLKQLDFKLDRARFIYGNIKPDFFPAGAESSHTIRDNMANVAEYAERLMNQNLDIKEYSLLLGVLCHYICDFFCIYHNEKYKSKNILEHILYEFKLHMNLRRLLAHGTFKSSLKAAVPKRDMWAIISDMQESYNLEMDSPVKDLNYAVTAAMSIAESIICCSELANIPAKKPQFNRVLIPAK